MMPILLTRLYTHVHDHYGMSEIHVRMDAICLCDAARPVPGAAKTHQALLEGPNLDRLGTLDLSPGVTPVRSCDAYSSALAQTPSRSLHTGNAKPHMAEISAHHSLFLAPHRAGGLRRQKHEGEHGHP